ncbi:unnamed protein product [Rotaria magnacalcarata]|uniref:Uncharacterized protein n=1 Tax=Rotaria magnacalcarata TaxID=392030 RepID=A0A8S2JJW9_9BILA|nr:unnamed protein product [Rotaria magnacalcarata]
MILIFIFINFMTIQSKLDEIFRTTSNNFLQSKVYFPVKYEESRETTEARRELCLDEFRQHETHYRRRPRLSSVCAHYCTTTMNCQSNQEQSACVSPLWSPETIKYVQKFKRICYVRITEILQYKQAKQMCHRYDLQLATIDNIQLLERLQQLNMFNTTCKGQCPKSRGYYIGLKRLLNQSKSKWIWSNNVSWTENEIDCDDYSHTSYANSSILCYIGSNGPKKITVWNENEPNNFRSPDYRGEEQCVEIIVHTGERSNNGSWVADRGCRFAGYVNNYAQCYCNHLTHFAVLMISNPQQSLELLSAFEELILTFVTYIGISLSIFGLVTTLITYVLFRDSQKNRSHISLMMLCLSILFVNCFYIPFSFTQSSSFKLNQHLFCTILGFLFHYFFIASFMWMLIMAIVQYNNFVRILNTHISHFYIKSCTIGWIVPLIFPSLVIVLGHNRGYTEESRCWINNQNLLNLTFLLPISTIILFNLILFGFILRSIFRHNAVVATQKKKYSKVQIGATLCCFVSIGCTWLFGIIVLIDPSFNHQLIFSICSSFQGFLIFLFHVYLSKPKRASWQSFFVQHGCHSHSNVSSDHKEITTVSYSTGRNASEITSSSRSNISRASTFSAADEHKTHHNIKTPTTTDHKRNELLNVVHLELSRL